MAALKGQYFIGLILSCLTECKELYEKIQYQKMFQLCLGTSRHSLRTCSIPYLHRWPIKFPYIWARLFADDTIVYSEINSISDSQILRQDLDKLTLWEKTWLMEFNPIKCEVLSVTRKRNPVAYSFSLQNDTLRRVSSTSYHQLWSKLEPTYFKHNRQGKPGAGICKAEHKHQVAYFQWSLVQSIVKSSQCYETLSQHQ